MKILFLTKGKDNPATRYRVEPVAGLLLARGDLVEILYEPGVIQQLKLIARLRSYDVVFIQRKLFGGMFVKLLGMLCRRLVFDFDDAIFLRSSGQISRTRKRRFDSIIARADLVFAGNSYLADATGAEAVTIVPTSVPLVRYPYPAPKTAREPLKMVWIGSRSTSRYLESHRSVLEALGARFPDVQLKVIGDFEASFSNLAVENVPWQQDSEIEQLMEAHIGIAPMSDDAWTRGKCALKIIQYMAAGLPVVSSRAGANAEVVIDGKTGFLVDSETEWISAVERLRGSSSLRQEMGRQGRLRAEADYDTGSVAGNVVTRLDQLCAMS